MIDAEDIIGSLFGLKNNPNQGEIVLNYFGPVNYEVCNYLIENVKKRSTDLKMDNMAKRKLRAVFVECVENLHRHVKTQEDGFNECAIQLELFPHAAYVRTINHVDEIQMEALRVMVEKNSNATQDELKSAYKEQISSKADRASGGAGVGLIQMAMEGHVDVEFTRLQSGEIVLKLNVKLDN